MNKLIRGLIVSTALVTISLLSANAMAEQHNEGATKQEMLAEMWVMIPKAGKMQELEKAMSEHVKFRRSKDDPRDWHFYSPVLGHKLDRIAVRANRFTWSDMDTYRDWAMKQGINKHWNDTAAQYVDHYNHYMSVEDDENSHWGPDVNYNYVGVTVYTPKIGHRGAIEKDKKAMADAAKAEKWPYHWAFSSEVGGRGELVLAVPYENWGAMAPPDEKFAEMLARHMGDESKAKELLEGWASHFEEIDYNIWALRKDLMGE